MITVLYILLVFFLVFANGFFVASEFALVGVRSSRIQTLAASVCDLRNAVNAQYCLGPRIVVILNQPVKITSQGVQET